MATAERDPDLRRISRTGNGRMQIVSYATSDGAAPGIVRVLQPRFASDFPRSLCAHDIGLCDLIEAAF